MNYQVRIVLHYDIPNNENHLDFFVDPGYKKQLITYELAPTFLKFFENHALESILQFQEISDFDSTSSHKIKGKANKKKDHQRKYLTYTGQIGPNKGFIKAVGNGVIESLPKKNEILIVIK